jgi:hypothetical protein
MTATIIILEHYREAPNPGNGGREALQQTLDLTFPFSGGAMVDDVLAQLCLLGFRIVPVGDEE